MTALARVVFGLLVVATSAAFFVAQELKTQPGVIVEFRREPLFSPNRDGRKDRANARFELRRADRVTVVVVDEVGDPVRELLAGRRAQPFREVRVQWDGTDDAGREVPDGRYRFRVALQRQGRTITLQQSTRKDTVPPRPRITSIGPDRARGPELLPKRDGAPARIAWEAPGRQAVLRVFRTAPGATRLAFERDVPAGRGRLAWDGTVDGRRVGPGTYLAVIESRDAAGNIGRSAALGEEGLPRLPFGERLPGRGGLEVRYLAVRPSLLPTTAGEPVDLLLDARGEPFRWSVRRVGGPRPVRRSGDRKTRPLVRLRTPGGRSGLFLFEARTRTRAARAPFAVDDREDHAVLVVLPALSWQGRNPVDDDGDGAPDTLDRGVAAGTDRVLLRETESFVRREAPILAALDRAGRRYDLTTDLALATGRGPRLEGHRGVLLPGDVRWLPAGTQRALRRFVQRGGVVATAGIDSLRRGVALTPGGRLVDPTPPAPADVFGARTGPVQREATTLTVAQDDLGLFATPTTAGSAGLLEGVTAFEPLRAWRRTVAAAETPGGSAVVAAARLGEGTVIRFGLPDIATRLDDPQVQALLERTWTLLSR